MTLGNSDFQAIHLLVINKTALAKLYHYYSIFISANFSIVEINVWWAKLVYLTLVGVMSWNCCIKLYVFGLKARNRRRNMDYFCTGYFWDFSLNHLLFHGKRINDKVTQHNSPFLSRCVVGVCRKAPQPFPFFPIAWEHTVIHILSFPLYVTQGRTILLEMLHKCYKSLQLVFSKCSFHSTLKPNFHFCTAHKLHKGRWAATHVQRLKSEDMMSHLCDSKGEVLHLKGPVSSRLFFFVPCPLFNGLGTSKQEHQGFRPALTPVHHFRSDSRE